MVRILMRNASWYRRTQPKVTNHKGNEVFIPLEQAIEHAKSQGWNKYLLKGAETPLGRYGTESGWANTNEPSNYSRREEGGEGDATQGSSTGDAAPIHLDNNGNPVGSLAEGFDLPIEGRINGRR